MFVQVGLVLEYQYKIQSGDDVLLALELINIFAFHTFYYHLAFSASLFFATELVYYLGRCGEGDNNCVLAAPQTLMVVPAAIVPAAGGAAAIV